MNHAEVRERMELAALEPDGLERLMAGDTPDSVIVAGHLAGCPTCLDEMGRLRRTASIVRGALAPATAQDPAPGMGSPTPVMVVAHAATTGIASTAEPALPPELKERTLAFIREFGVPRPRVEAVPDAATLAAAAPAVTAPGGPRPLRAATRGSGPGFLRPAAWVASIAAAVLLAVVATTLYTGSGRTSDETADLSRLAAWTIDVAHAPDARQVSLTSPAGAAPAGLLAFDPSSGKLVVSVHDLAPASSGKEYRCWMEVAGARTTVGRMFFAGGIAYWVGPVTGLATAPAGTRFGVTLVDATGSSNDGDPALVGSL